MGATTGCEFAWNSSSCEALSNLCALQLYDTSASACQYYLRIAQQRAQLSSDTSASLPLLPSLYYTTGASDAGFITSQVIDLPLAVSAEKRVSSLPLVLATYSLNGTFIGLQEVATQLQKCASDPIDQLGVWRNIGHDYDTSCSVNLASLVSKYPSTVFYDMYIKDQSDKLIPVPIRLINYRSGGRQPNLNPDPWNFASNTFFRRFFVVDSVSGVENSVLRAVRIASKIHFWVRKESTGRIYVPIVDLTYTERDATLLSASDSSYQSSPTVEFGIQYITELDSFWKAVTVLFALICVIGGFLALFRARAWSSRNLGPADGWDFQYLVRCILILAEVLAPLLFWLLLTLSMYWFFAFKSQSELNVLLPYSDRDMTRLNAAHATSLACYALHVVTKLYQQCTADIFLIDWEQSKGRIIQSGADERPKLAPISVWRSVFLANEWDELQTYRQVNIEFMLLAMYFIFEGLQVRYAATPQPDMNNLTPGAVHRILLFALEGMVWIGLAAVQILFRKIVYDRYYKNKLFNFVDVLSMANLSILAFDEMCHGYYIHGRSIHPCADTNIGELNAYLRREKADLVPRRGLDDTDEQCFEMFAQKEMRSAFNKVYGIVIAEVETQMAGNLAARLQRLSPEKQLRRFGGVDEARVRAYETVNHFLKSFFDRNLKEFQYMVRERTHVERLLAKTPDVSHSTALFHDPACFTNLLLHGIEYHLLLFYVLVFSLASYTLDSTGAAALITCLVDVLVRVGRRHFGGKNVAKKMMMDPKFLI
ncbi:Meckelin [Powellomyces hirtus]|nr:Meckelin [Powellomyces hirtus]